MKPANASRQPFRFNSFRGTKRLWWNNPPTPPPPPPPPPQKNALSISPIHVFIHELLESSIFFSRICRSTPCVLVGPSSPVSADCQWKGQPSFSQRRMSLPVPHPPQRVHKNLHNSGRKCQYIESMAIRRLRHYYCLPRCDSDELAESNLSGDVARRVDESRCAPLDTRGRDIVSLVHFLWLLCVQERLTSSGESKPEEISPSCSWQDSGSFLCLSRKREKSDFLVFHLHAQRTGDRCLHMFGSSCRTLLEYAAFMFVSLSLCLCRSHISHTHRHM